MGLHPTTKRKAETSPVRLLREPRGVRLRALAASKGTLRWRALIARAALASWLWLLSLGMSERPRDRTVDVEPERVHFQLVGERGGTHSKKTTLVTTLVTTGQGS